MHDEAPVYGGWESAPASWAQRSYLYALAPIGVGTAAVESFTGYVARLAAVHTVEAGTLVNRELLPRVPYTKGASKGRAPSRLPSYSFYIDAYTLNGTGERSRLWVSLLEELACVDRLELLTLLPWTKAIACVHLLRTQRAWCPCCYGAEPPVAPSVYERLSWTLQAVTACPAHRCPLESICRSCGRTQYVFSPKSRPGFCSRCQHWLGRKPESVDHDLTVPIRIAEMVGELLAASPGLPTDFGLDQFRENVRILARGGGRCAAIQYHHIREWIRGRAPHMDSLTALSLSQEISMVRLLTERIDASDTGPPRSPQIHYRVAGHTVEEALRTALREKIPPTLMEIAAHIGYRSVAPLKNRYRDLCGQVVSKRQSGLKSSPPPSNAPVPRERIEQALFEALNNEGPVSLHSVAASVGLRTMRRLYKGFHDLRHAIVAKNRRLKEQRVEVIERTFRAAFDETPVPTVTEVARRLGLRHVTRITRRFPDLSVALRRRRQAALSD